MDALKSRDLSKMCRNFCIWIQHSSFGRSGRLISPCCAVLFAALFAHWEREKDFQMVPDETALADEATEEDEDDEKRAQANKEKQL